QADDLCVQQRVLLANRLTVELVELAETSRLGAIVAKGVDKRKEPHRLGTRMHPMLNVGADNRRGALGTQRQVVATLILEGVHFLLDDVGGCAHAPGKKPRVFERGSSYLSIAEALSVLPRGLFDV